MLTVMLALMTLGFQTPAPKTAAAVRTVEMSAGDTMKYSVPRITAMRGEKLRLVLSVTSKFPKNQMAHNIVVLAKGVNAAKLNAAALTAAATDYIPQERKAEIIAYTGLAGGGEKVEVTFTVPSQSGDYEFVCTFPGHFALGMKGVIVVK